MQSVEIDLGRVPILSTIKRLYNIVSAPVERNSVLPECFDDSFSSVFDVLEKYVPWFNRPITKSMRSIPIDYLHNDRDVIVCVSGGKDSVATAIKLKEQGYNVYLYHLHGINKTYYNEYQAVEDVAKVLDLPCFIDECVLKGEHKFVEHPLKNYIIASGAICFALHINVAPNIAFGNFTNSPIEELPFNVCGGDSIDMWAAYEKIVQTVIPDFHIMLPLETQADTMNIISNHLEVLPYCMSCISPYRFRTYWKERTEKNYGIRLMENRCGCCWKCAVEYITFADKDYLEYNEAYYIHCLEVLGRTMQKEEDVYAIHMEDLWETYISTPIEKSKLGDKIHYGIVQNGKAKFEK